MRVIISSSFQKAGDFQSSFARVIICLFIVGPNNMTLVRPVDFVLTKFILVNPQFAL